MMFRFSTLFLFGVFISWTSAESYEGHKVYLVKAANESQSLFLKSLEDNEDYDIWSEVNRVGNPVTLRVAPNAQRDFESFLTKYNVDYDILIDDVERTIEAERNYHRSLPKATSRITFDRYYRHAEINAYLRELAAAFPSLVQVFSIGKSYENRDILAIKISTGSSVPAKPVILVDAGIHAREWIAPAVALYLINQLVENTSNAALIGNVDWIIIPSLNPDGYEYTWTNSRMWRKTRSPGYLCAGCDPNRNFDYQWMYAGASSNECSETYAGSTAFSEIETRNLRDLILSTQNIKAYLTFHSYGNYILYPWGYASLYPPNRVELDNLGKSIRDAIRGVSGTTYSVGGAAALLYPAAGASDDWAYAVGKINLVYCIELPGGGSQGFDLPANRISAVVRETLEGVKVVHNYVRSNYA